MCGNWCGRHLDSEFRVESAADPNARAGSTIRNLHFSEVARSSRDGAEALTSLRAAVPPVVMEGKFKDGLGKIIDGVVQCLNASVWAKKAAVSN